MQQSYLIYSDISADLPAAYARERGIRFVPMSYTLGDEERVCDRMEDEEVLKRFYGGQRAGSLTRTSQISPQVYIDLFRPILEGGTSVLYLSLSSGLSGTYQSSCAAAEDLNAEFPEARLRCVDSLSATGGMGLLLASAADNRDAGMSLEENAAWLEENRLRVCHWFMVEDLQYLRRGGRISAATAVIGSALNIKPILTIADDGTLLTIAKARGEKAAIRQLAEYYDLTASGGEGERILVMHADNLPAAERLEGELKSRNPAARLARVYLNPIIGAHTGPGMCAFVTYGERGGWRK